MEATQAKLQALYAKQGRSRQFKSKAERDAFLNKEVGDLAEYEKLQRKTVADLERDLAAAQSQLEEVTGRAAEHLQGEDERRDHLRKMGEAATKLKSDVDNMQEKRK